ncbi:MAG TPA: hypothetical protein VGM82_21295 [Gemmatimonadaceae bacterium]|jgi:hypothetical protein
MGCLFRLGCLFLLVCAAIVGWFTRDRWMPKPWLDKLSPPAKVAMWEPLTSKGADKTRAALDRLSQPSGPVFETLSGADVASYAFRELSQRMPASADSIQARVSGEKISMRANINTSELKGIGAFAAMLGDREPIELTGTLRVVNPGLGEFQVQDAKVRGLSIPHAMISTLIGRVDRGPRKSGVDADAMPLPLPAYVGDIRVANGKITLYKNVR